LPIRGSASISLSAWFVVFFSIWSFFLFSTSVQVAIVQAVSATGVLMGQGAAVSVTALRAVLALRCARPLRLLSLIEGFAPLPTLSDQPDLKHTASMQGSKM
jgi:hypothetical protein